MDRRNNYIDGRDIIGGTVVDYGIGRIGEKRLVLDALIKEQDEVAGITARLKQFIDQADGGARNRTVEDQKTSIRAKLGGFIKSVFGKEEAPVQDSQKVTLAKEYLARLEGLRATINDDIKNMARTHVDVMPSQRLDSLDALRKDAYANRTVSHELGWIVGAKPAVEMEVSNEAPAAPTQPQIYDMGPNVISMARERVRKEWSARPSAGTMPSAMVPQATRMEQPNRIGFRPAAPVQNATYGNGARPIVREQDNVSQIRPTEALLLEDKTAYLETLNCRNDQLAIMDAKLEDKIAKLESASAMSKISSFFKGNSISNQLSELKAQKRGVARRCREIEAKIITAEESLKKAA